MQTEISVSHFVFLVEFVTIFFKNLQYSLTETKLTTNIFNIRPEKCLN